jgi:hypothetical protein
MPFLLLAQSSLSRCTLSSDPMIFYVSLRHMYRCRYY